MSFLNIKKEKTPVKNETKKEVKEEVKKPETKSVPAKHISKNVLVKPWITEKSTDLSAENKYVFLVAKDATKPLVRENVMKKYNVKVTNVDMVYIKGKVKSFRGKTSRRSPVKKAIITLKKGDKIEIQ